MKFRKLDNWDDPAQTNGLVFLAQLLDEMLFDYSLDTYKPSVLHTGLLVDEALQTIREIERGIIRAPNLQHVIAELCSNLDKDPVAKALLTLKPEVFFPTLKNPKTPIKEVETVLRVLDQQLPTKRYREKIEELLIAELMGNQSHSEIRRLARSYVTSLIATGFSQKYLSDELFKFFYTSTNRVSSPKFAQGLSTLFPKEGAEFTAIFRVDRIFNQFSKSLDSIGITIAKHPKDLDQAQLNLIASADDGRFFAVIPKISARDPISARSIAETRLQLAGTLINLFHHKEDPSLLPEALIVEPKSGTYRRIGKPLNSMHKCGDLLHHVAHKKLGLFLSDFTMETDSFIKFIRSSQLHSMALSSNSTENQLLNLWISIESLVPSETRDEDSATIEHICNSIVPFFNVNYLEKLVNNLGKL